MKELPLPPATGVLRSIRIWLCAVTIITVGGCGAVVQTAPTSSPFPAQSVPSGSGSLTFHGWVRAGQLAIENATIQVYAAGSAGTATPAQALVARPPVSDVNGNFAVSFSCPTPNAEIYAVATDGAVGSVSGSTNSAIALMTMLGPCGNLSESIPIAINEVTTVGSAWAYSSYISSASKLGSAPNDSGFSAAGQLVNQLVNLPKGTSPGTGVPSGYVVQTRKLNDLANALNSCLISPGGTAGDGTPCGTLFALATPPGATPPVDTVGAALLMARNPSESLEGIFALSSDSSPYQPILNNVPDNWSLLLLPAPAAPELNPSSGSYASGQQITLAEATPDAVIHYTTDGTQPLASSPVYGAPLLLTGAETVKAVAMEEEISSEVASASYSLTRPPVPTFSPAPGSYTSTESVTILDDDASAGIYYTTDGSAPTASSRKYASPIILTASAAFRAVAFDGGIGSPVASGSYKIAPPPAPVFSPGPGSYNSAQSLSLSDGDASAAIYYTTDGSTPTTSSRKYAGPISLTASVTLSAVAVEGGLSSSVAVGNYSITSQAINIKVSPATVTLQAGQTYSFAATVTGSSNTAVTWSISPAIGTISSTGVYVAPSSTAAPQAVIVTAVSIANPTTFGSATITLKPAPLPTTPGFALAGLVSPATVAESIFVYASGLSNAVSVSYSIDGRMVSSESLPPYWLGGQTAGAPNGFSINSAGNGTHVLSAIATLQDGNQLTSNSITLNVVPSVNATLSSTLASYPNQLSAQLNSVQTVLANVTTSGAVLTPQELQTREQVLTMYMNWGIDPSLDYTNDESSVLASLAPPKWKAPAAIATGQDLSMAFSPDAPAYQPIPAAWPRVVLPSSYLKTVQLNTTVAGDGLGYGEVSASPADPKLPVHSEWYSVASTLAIFPFPMPADWFASLPVQPAGDSHMIFADPASQTFVSSYKTTLNPATGGPDALYASRPTAFNSLGDRGGSTASSFAELPFLIQPGEATDPQKPIRHAIGGALGRTWAARVYPASARDANVLASTNSCTGQRYTNTGLIPYGGVIQLDPQLDLTKLGLSLPAFRILQAMQTYGYYVMDFGCADFDIYSSLSETELDPYGGLWGYNKKGPGVQNEIQAVLVANKLFVVAPLTKKQ